MSTTNFSNSILDKIRNVENTKTDLMDYASNELQDKDSNKNLEEMQNDLESIKEFESLHNKKPLVRKEAKIMPNDPCPCGSGKKYKKCHGKNVTTEYIRK